MADTDIVQVIAEARIDARSLSEFVWKPADFMVTRRLAPPINTLNFYIDKLNNYTAGLDVKLNDANVVIDNKVSQSKAQIDVIVNDARLDSISKTSSIVQIVKDDINSVLNQTIENASFNIIDSFELGATLTKRTDALRHTTTGKLYRWGGNLPKVVPTNSTPANSGGFGSNAWLEVSDVALRQELQSDKGHWLVNNQMAANAYGAPAKLTNPVFDKSMRYNVCDYFDGYFWGIVSSQVARSTDGVSWESIGSHPGGTPGRMIKTSDGEVLFQVSERIYKSTGWASEAPTWRIVLTNPSSAIETPILRWGFDGEGSKFIVTHYGAGGGNSEQWGKSRYVWISTDAGETWQVVYDTDAESGGSPQDSHIHAACYDKWDDRFYFTEGHGAVVGIRYSDDNGTTWTRITKDRGLSPAFTTMTPTDFGIVCGTDSEDHGVYLLQRSANPDDVGIELLARYPNPNAVDGVIGFADRGVRDPDTGIVYIGYISNYPNVTPYVFAVGSGGATAALAMPPNTGSGSGFASVRFYNVVAGNGRLLGEVMGHSTVTGSFSADLPKYNLPVSSITGDYGNLLPHDTVQTRASGMRAGNGSVVDALRSMAIGRNASATAGQDLIAVGTLAKVAGNGSLAIGYNADASAQYSSAIGFNSSAKANDTVAFGKGATAIGVGSTAIGVGSIANTTSTAIGSGCVSGQYSTAVGFGAKSAGLYSAAFGQNSSSAGAQSLAVGHGSKANFTQATAIGTESLVSNTHGIAIGHQSESAFHSVAVGTTAKATGNSSVAIGYNATVLSSTINQIAIGENAKTTAENTIAIGFGATVSFPSCIAIGTGATATHESSVAIGRGVASTRASTVSIGARDIESTKNGGAIYLKSPDGTTYKVTVDDSGALVVVAA